MLAEGDGDGLGSVRRADLLKERFDVFDLFLEELAAFARGDSTQRDVPYEDRDERGDSNERGDRQNRNDRGDRQDRNDRNDC